MHDESSGGVRVVFDLDGTLVDPLVGFRDSINSALSETGHRPRTSAELVSLIGPPLDEGFRSLLGEIGAADVAALIQAYRRHYDTHGWAKNSLYDGVSRMLSTLVGRGVRLGVCTSKRRDFAVRILEQHGLIARLDFVDGGDVGISKASQLGALVANGRVSPHAIMVGDRAVDVVAAHSCGLRAIAVTYGYGTPDELRAAGADALVDDPAKIEQALDSLTRDHPPTRGPVTRT